MHKTYTIDYFINKFENIPEENWITGHWNRDGKHCAEGHCGYPNRYLEASALTDIFLKNGVHTCNVNDIKSERFPQETPKQRILAALREFKHA